MWPTWTTSARWFWTTMAASSTPCSSRPWSRSMWSTRTIRCTFSIRKSSRILAASSGAKSTRSSIWSIWRRTDWSTSSSPDPICSPSRRVATSTATLRTLVTAYGTGWVGKFFKGLDGQWSFSCCIRFKVSKLIFLAFAQKLNDLADFEHCYTNYYTIGRTIPLRVLVCTEIQCKSTMRSFDDIW